MNRIKERFKEVGSKFKEELVKVGKQAGKDIVAEFGRAVGIEPDKNNSSSEREDFDIPKVDSKNGTYYGKAKQDLFSKKVYFPYGDWKPKLIVGAAGAGKNTLAENLVYNTSTGIAFLDNAKGSSINKIVRALPRDRLKNKTVVLDHSIREKPLAVGNIKGVDNVFENNRIVAHFEDFFVTNFDLEDKFRTRKLIKYALKATLAVENMTLLDVIKFVEHKKYRDHILRKIKGKREYQDVVEYWNRFDGKEMSDSQRRNYIQPFLNRTGNLEGDIILKITLGQKPKKELNYKKWVNEGYTVLIKIPERKLPKEAVRIISAFHVLNIWRACLSRGDVFDQPKRQFTVIADEPQGWLGRNEQVLENIFSKARAYRMNMICLIQSTEQVSGESRNLLKVMLDNNPDIIALSKTELFSNFDFDKLKKYHFLAKVQNKKFVAKAPKPVTTKFKRSQKQAKKFIKDFRHKYNRDYKEVLKRVDRRLRRWEETSTEKNGGSQNVGGEKTVSTGSPTKTDQYSNSSISTNF